MAFVLDAVVADLATPRRLQRALIVPLRQGFGLFPLTTAFWRDDEVGLPLVTQADEERERDSEHREGDTGPGTNHQRARAAFARVASICAALSEGSVVAYVEAELWAGDGDRAAAAWVDGQMALAPTVGPDAINTALRAIGVRCVGPDDGFAAIDLGRHRDTEDWAIE